MRGRKSQYTPDYVELAYELALLGAPDHRIAEIIGIGPDQFSRWQRRFPELVQALKRGRDQADAKVAASLYKRACGFSYVESKREADGKTTHTKKQVPPDTGACIYWLNNRQKEHWRQTFTIDERARAELETEIDRELERLAALETKGLPRSDPPTTH